MRSCEVYRCEEKHEARGYCHKHYASYGRHGSPFGSNRPPGAPLPKRARHDPSGETHGEWVILGWSAPPPRPGSVRARCSCGFEADRQYHSIKSGQSRSCGHVMGWNQVPILRAPAKATPEARKQYAKDTRKRKAAFIGQYKMEQGCQDCGLVPLHSLALHFDHLPEYEKEFNLSKATSYSMGRIATEIYTCEVVCANCHAVRTAERLVA